MTAAQSVPCWPEPDTSQIKRFLELLGKPPGTSRLRAFFPSGDPRKAGDPGAKGSGKPQLIREWQVEGRGIYLVINDGGDTDAEITFCRALFCEWDDKPIEWQLTAWQELGLPEPTFMVATGGKSIHCYWVLAEPIHRDRWRAIQKRLLDYANADRSLRNPSRVMRLPGCWYMHPETRPGELVQIIHESGCRYAAEQIEVCLLEPEPAPAPARAAPAPGQADAVLLAQLLPRDQLRLWQRGVGEGQRNDTAFSLACQLLALRDASGAAGLATSGSPEDALLEFASRCSPPFPEAEALKCLRSAQSQPRQPDSGWPERLRFNLNRHDKQDRHQQAPAARPQQQADGQGLLPPAAEPSPAIAVSRKTRVGADEVLTLLPYHLGDLRLNLRSGEVHSSARGVISANQISRMYLELSKPFEVWPKEGTADGITLLASRNPFDPVQEYLEGITAEPLLVEQWQRLDQHLLGIDDPIAAAFLPRYFISAVARAFEPGCYVRQVPVLIGSQERGKGELGRILFGAEKWVEGIGALDRDALMKCHTAWGVELAEMDGITRRSDQEHLKAFITETADTYRKPYDRSPERHERRFVFWGTSNRPPLRDSTGSTRFVCIPIPDRPLPLEWAREYRDALWAMALHQYRSGVTWLRTSEEERRAVEERNSAFTEMDPWGDLVGQFLRRAQLEGALPVKVNEVLKHLEVPTEKQNTAATKRVREIAEGLGWQHGRRRFKGSDPLQGLWPADETVHLVHPSVHPSYTPAGASRREASGPCVHPVHPIPPTLEKQEMGEQGEEALEVVQKVLVSEGCTRLAKGQIDCSSEDLPRSTGVHEGVHSTSTPSTTTDWVRLALHELGLAPHTAMVSRVMAWLEQAPEQPTCTRSAVTAAMVRLQEEDSVDETAAPLAA
jgi:hypothetical protein